MAFVLDCSVTMAWVFPDEANDDTDALRESLLQERAIVPALWPIEVANVLLVATRSGRVRRSDWARIRRDLDDLPIDIDPDSCANVLTLVLPMASQYGISVYDAMYLELASRLSLPLATVDAALARAARSARVRVR